MRRAPHTLHADAACVALAAAELFAFVLFLAGLCGFVAIFS